MKLARAKDLWKGVYLKKRRTLVHALAFENVIGIGTGTVPCKGAILTICGGNGVGKSTFLDAIVGSIDAAALDQRPMRAARLRGSAITVEMLANGKEVRVTSTFIADEEAREPAVQNVTIQLVDPSTESADLIGYFADEDNLDELLEGFQPRESDEDELNTLSFLVGKKYDACKTYELEGIWDDVEAIPYFIVSSGGAEYSTWQMGQGELSLFLMHWHIKRAESESIIVIEEPETHISPRSQRAIMDTLARVSTTTPFTAIITTHSPTVVASCPADHVRLLYRDKNGVGVIAHPSESDLANSLGMPSRFVGAILVEDAAAKEFCIALLRRLLPEAILQYEIRDAGSVSQVREILAKLPKLSAWVNFVGILDGDQEPPQMNWPCVSLPGGASPETILKGPAEGNVVRLAELLRIDAARLSVVIDAHRGSNEHDWYHEIVKALGLDYSQFMGALVDVWLETGNNRAVAEGFCEALAALLWDH